MHGILAKAITQFLDAAGALRCDECDGLHL